MGDTSYAQGMTRLRCYHCFLPFYTPDQFAESMKATGRTFYCPQGHSQQFGGSELERLRIRVKELEHGNGTQTTTGVTFWRLSPGASESDASGAKTHVAVDGVFRCRTARTCKENNNGHPDGWGQVKPSKETSFCRVCVNAHRWGHAKMVAEAIRHWGIEPPERINVGR